MELLYIWIENFRKIKEQGFNFSNQYQIEYKSDSNSIIILDIDSETSPFSIENGDLNFVNIDNHYLQNFFSSKIININAIIGKNSSGKSNLLDFLITAFSVGNRNLLDTKYVLIFKKDNTPFFWGKTNGSLQTSTINYQNQSIPRLDPAINWLSMFYSNVSDNKEYIFEGSKNLYNFSYSEINKVQSNKIEFVSSDEFLNVKNKLDPESHNDIKFLFKPISFLKLENSTTNNNLISGILKRYRKAIFQESKNNFNRFKYGVTINLFSHVILHKKETPILNDIQLIGSDNYAEPINTLHPKIVTFLNHFQDYASLEDISENEFKSHMDLISRFQTDVSYNLGTADRKERSDINNASISVDFNDDFKKLIEGKLVLFNNYSVLSHDWSKLSSGMRAYLNLFSQLYFVSKDITDFSKNLLICIDEGDLYLHPEWQRNFLQDLIEFVSEIFQNKIQIILTSHSPFLISDLPKENVILLDDKGLAIRKLTDSSSFGANIHQLYTKQFFLKDGAIGEFAKNKIAKLLDEVKNTGDLEIKIIQKKIAMIGEPVLRYRLEELLTERVQESNKQTKIDWHMEQINKLRNS